MHTIGEAFVHECAPIKGSRFLCYLAPVNSEEIAKAQLANVRSAHPAASHHCSAWRIARPRVDRCSDDGEPSGSAGRPMLARLEGHQVIDVAAVVVRYFGGTKLGVGGLVRAYGAAVGEALDRCRKLHHVSTVSARIRHGYEDEAAVVAALRAIRTVTVSAEYQAEIERIVVVAAHDAATLDDALRNATSGRLEAVWL